MKKFNTTPWILSLEVAADRMADYGHSITAKHLRDLSAWILTNLRTLEAMGMLSPKHPESTKSTRDKTDYARLLKEGYWKCETCHAIAALTHKICPNCKRPKIATRGPERCPRCSRPITGPKWLCSKGCKPLTPEEIAQRLPPQS